MKVNEKIFFPCLKRRTAYRKNANGQYYAYGQYKQEIREDCLGRCVYCDVHENENGGQDSMNLDHFRPKKYEEHEQLINDPNNLVWSCSGCNRLKSDRWPALGTSATYVGSEGFVDPFSEDRLEYFVILEDGEIRSKKAPADYIIQVLALNRVSRKRLRELRILTKNLLGGLDSQISKLRDCSENLESLEELKSELEGVADSIEIVRKQLEVRLLDFQLH